MNPYVAMIVPSTPNPRLSAALLPAGRKLAEVLRKASGMKVTTVHRDGGLMLATIGNRDIDDDTRQHLTAVLQDACDRQWRPALMKVSGYTSAALPV